MLRLIVFLSRDPEESRRRHIIGDFERMSVAHRTRGPHPFADEEEGL